MLVEMVEYYETLGQNIISFYFTELTYINSLSLCGEFFSNWLVEFWVINKSGEIQFEFFPFQIHAL